MTGSRRGARALVGTLTFGMIFALAGPAPAAAPHRNPAMQKRLAGLAAANRPVGTLHARTGRSGLEVPKRSTSPEQYLRAAGDLRDPRTYAKAARAMAEATWGVTLPDPRAQSFDADAGDTIRLGLPGGDLTGDGLDDALSLEYSWSDWEFLSLRGFRGTDGDALWSVPLDGAYDAWPLLVGDLTGDGAEDILLTRFDYDGSGACFVVGCAYDEAFSWTYSLLSGADGSAAWTRTYDGHVTAALGYAGAIVAGAYAVIYDGTNVLVSPALSGDHDSDGVSDLVFNAYDATVARGGQYVVVGVVYEDLALVTTRGEIVSGADGSARLIRTQEDVPEGASLVPVGDAVGNATGDLVWRTISDVHSPLACVYALVAYRCAQVSRQSIHLEMLDGEDLTTAWNTDIGDDDTSFAVASAAGADLTGDGANDLLLSEVSATQGPLIGVVSGATGATTWRRSSDGFMDVIGPVGGGAGSDLLSINFHEDGDGSAINVLMKRIDGATGEELFASERSFAYPKGSFTDIYVYLPGDTDGDGAVDVAIDALSWGSTEASRTVVESGATAATLLDRSVDGFAFTGPGGDMDADGDQDILDLAVAYPDDAYAVTFTGRAMGTGALWSRTDGFIPCFGLLVLIGGDQSGLGGDDQIYSRLQCVDEGLESRIDGAEQTTGAITWGYGSTLSVPAALGAISGTITDERGHPVWGCVDVWQRDGDYYRYVTGDIAGLDGTYRVGGLSAGSYTVEFWDCDRGVLAGEYYDDKTDIDAADPVAVTLGNVTSGIDAVLALAGPEADPPANDDFANAEALSAGSQVTADTRGATLEPAEPDPTCDQTGRTVWYRFTATTTREVALTTGGSDYDTMLGVYTGSDLSTLTEIACNDDVAWYVAGSGVTFSAAAGETYYIQAGGYTGDAGALTLTIA